MKQPTEKEYKNQAYAVGTPCNSGTRKVRGTAAVRVDGVELELVPFVENLLRGVTLAVVSELDGYRDGAVVEITLE